MVLQAAVFGLDAVELLDGVIVLEAAAVVLQDVENDLLGRVGILMEEVRTIGKAVANDGSLE